MKDQKKFCLDALKRMEIQKYEQRMYERKKMIIVPTTVIVFILLSVLCAPIGYYTFIADQFSILDPENTVVIPVYWDIYKVFMGLHEDPDTCVGFAVFGAMLIVPIVTFILGGILKLACKPMDRPMKMDDNLLNNEDCTISSVYSKAKKLSDERSSKKYPGRIFVLPCILAVIASVIATLTMGGELDMESGTSEGMLLFMVIHVLVLWFTAGGLVNHVFPFMPVNDAKKIADEIEQMQEESKPRKSSTYSGSSYSGSSYSGSTYTPTTRQPSGWTDFRTGETLYREGDKIVNSKGEEVSPAWWE